MDYVNITSTSGYTGDGKRKIYAFVNGGSRDWWNVVAVADDGECVGGHVCSHPCFGPGDMGCTAQDWSNKREKYAEKFPEGYTLEWIDNLDKRPDVMAIIKAANEREAAKATKGTS